jgi:endonuclease-3
MTRAPKTLARRRPSAVGPVLPDPAQVDAAQVDPGQVDPRLADPTLAGQPEPPPAAKLRTRARPRGPAKPLHGSAEAPRRARIMNRQQAGDFVRALAAANPAPETELHFTTPYTLLVAVALSAQATDVSVNKATATLFRDAATPAAMVALGEEGVGRHIRSIGLWKGKAKNVVALSRLLLERHGGEVPPDRAALEALPGVGRKTANVVLNVAFGAEAMAVDTHIFRLGNRTGLAPGKTPREVEDGLMKRVPAELLRDAHHWLILHGRYVCKARMPECWRCVAIALCNYRDKVRVAPLR